MFLHHKKEGCVVNITIPDQQQNCLPAIQLPEFQNARRAPELHSQSILLPPLTGQPLVINAYATVGFRTLCLA